MKNLGTLHGWHCMQHVDMMMAAKIGMGKVTEKNTTSSWNQIN